MLQSCPCEVSQCSAGCLRPCYRQITWVRLCLGAAKRGGLRGFRRGGCRYPLLAFRNEPTSAAKQFGRRVDLYVIAVKDCTVQSLHKTFVEALARRVRLAQSVSGREGFAQLDANDLAPSIGYLFNCDDFVPIDDDVPRPTAGQKKLTRSHADHNRKMMAPVITADDGSRTSDADESPGANVLRLCQRRSPIQAEHKEDHAEANHQPRRQE
jgi:hypothetical protein